MSENEIRVLYVQPGIASALSAMILERLTSYHLTVFTDIQTFLQALFSFVVVAGGILSA